MTVALPPHGRLAGIDYGTVRIGIAICDPNRTLASPLENYTRRGPAGDEKRFQRLVAEEQIVGFVVGLPIHCGGQESQQSFEARKFGKWLSQSTGIPVVFHDERFTSLEADQWLGEARMTRKKRRNRRDMLAAQSLLASFLESAASRPASGDAAQAAPPEPGPLDDSHRR